MKSLKELSALKVISNFNNYQKLLVDNNDYGTLRSQLLTIVNSDCITVILEILKLRHHKYIRDFYPFEMLQLTRSRENLITETLKYRDQYSIDKLRNSGDCVYVVKVSVIICFLFDIQGIIDNKIPKNLGSEMIRIYKNNIETAFSWLLKNNENYMTMVSKVYERIKELEYLNSL